MPSSLRIVGLALGVMFGCGGDSKTADSPADVEVDRPDVEPTPDEVVTACDAVVVADAAGATVEGWPLVYSESQDGDLSFRAPAVARPTFLTVGSTLLRVDPAPGNFEIPGLAADCGSFAHGVASGDPRPDGVTLWTRYSTDGADAVPLRWAVSTNPAMSAPVAEGEAIAAPNRDWTVHVDVAGLAPATTYYYRFQDPSGEASTLGRTRTAGGETLRFAVASCSSLYSGWFNAYRRIGERNDLDLVIHLGDYIYDFVDEDETIRVPLSGSVEDPTDLAGHRRRHADYLSDPDLRAARAAHPWFLLWDNHDLVRNAPDFGGGVQAFREWNPLPPMPPDGSREQIYRVLRWGRLADLFLIDMLLFQREATLPSGAPGVLGDAQFAWLQTELRASQAQWRVLGMQKVFAEFGPFSGWQDFPEARSRLIRFLADENIGNNLFLSGDSHFTLFQDVVDDPLNMTQPYDPTTGIGAVGAELMASSITRGNFDEQLGTTATMLVDPLRSGFLEQNPHQVDMELTQHGYGVVDVQAERVVTELWYSPILEPSDRETFGGAYAIDDGQNRFRRTPITTPTSRTE
ncbi:MAG: alkaline phosphatase D family protein [Myxococcota bacterium]